MKQLRKPDQRILQIIEQKIPAVGTPLKLSQFAVPVSIDTKKLLFHTLTRECLQIDSDLNLPLVYKNDGSIPDELISHRFLVKPDANETELYCTLLKIMRSTYSFDGIKLYTILPTTFCNARCFYCYERDFHFMNMPESVIDKTVELIEKTRSDKGIQIRWFGGEPLLGVRVIRKITDSLRLKEIPFYSSMVSNGFLFNDDIVKEAKEHWNLRTVQITLDGDEAEYNTRKQYIVNNDSPFKKVINSIHLLRKSGIKVNIRLNIDRDNIESMKRLSGFLAEEFPEKENLYLYAHPLFHEFSTEGSLPIWNAVFKTEQYFHDRGFTLPAHHKINRIQPFYCMADNPSELIVNVDGFLYNCEHCHEESRICSIDDYLMNPSKKTVPAREVSDKCQHCAFLPNCTDFQDCPNRKNEIQCMEIEYTKLINILRNSLY